MQIFPIFHLFKKLFTKTILIHYPVPVVNNIFPKLIHNLYPKKLYIDLHRKKFLCNIKKIIFIGTFNKNPIF